MDVQANRPTEVLAELDFSRRSRARREQTSRDLDALRGKIVEWLKRHRKTDTLERHRNHLEAIEKVLLGVLETLARQPADAADTQAGKIYDDCRRIAQATVWLERLWQFISTKFDQRFEETPDALMLRAADEVIWSCYSQVIKGLPLAHPARLRGLMPLAHIEPEYSPSAVLFDQQVPPGLRLRSGNPTLDRCLENVPLPTLRLPPWCVSAPWGLVLIAHEVGHHVQHELDIVADFAEQLGEVAGRANLDSASIDLWAAWGEEVFADALSVYAMGPPAIVAITELEWTDNRNLAVRKAHYPAPAIRLALMTRLAELEGLDTKGLVPLQQLEGVVQDNEITRADWKALDPVVALLRSALPGGIASLSRLCNFEKTPFAPRGTIAQHAEGLRGIGSMNIKTEKEDARHMASAAVVAWLTFLAEPDEKTRRENLCRLASGIPEVIMKCGEPTLRSGAGAEVAPQAVRDIASFLLEAALSSGKGDPQ
jgi:hypothetical protein